MFYSLAKMNYTSSDEYGNVVDATRKGNNARLANHSCYPNTVNISVVDNDNNPRQVLRAIKDIKSGEEITWNYNEVVDKKSDLVRCNEEACRGSVVYMNRVRTKEEKMEMEEMRKQQIRERAARVMARQFEKSKNEVRIRGSDVYKAGPVGEDGLQNLKYDGPSTQELNETKEHREHIVGHMQSY